VLPNSTTDCAQKPVPVTVSVVFPLPAFTVAGEMLLITGAGFTRVTEAVAESAEFATLAAVTVTVLGDGSVAGAVYSPVVSIVPLAAVPLTDHVTPALPPLTEAENWICPPSTTCALCGATETSIT
jgi:hypothetical protein